MAIPFTPTAEFLACRREDTNLQSLQPQALFPPVRLLSPDLIDLVLEYAAPQPTEEYPKYDPAVYFSQVCSDWRFRALNHPLLWSTFTIYLFPTPEPEENHQVIDRINLFVSRSHPLPLHVSLIGTSTPTYNQRMFPSALPILESLLCASDRLATLNLSECFLVHEVSWNLPILSSLRLCAVERGRSLPNGGGLNAIVVAAPRLRNLVVQDLFFWCWDRSAIRAPWKQLSALEISADRFFYQTPVASLTNLTKLVLHGSTHGAPSVTLPLLATLVIDVISTITQLKTPQLTSFVTFGACTYSDNRRLLDSFIVHSTRLRDLTLTINPDPCEVINVLQLVPELESLHLRAPLQASRNEQSYYTHEFIEEFNKFFMSWNLDDLENLSQVLLPKLKYLTLSCPRLLREQFLRMIQLRCDPPHKLLRLELWLDEPETVSPEQLTSITDDWGEIRDGLLLLMKEGKMDVRIYNSV